MHIKGHENVSRLGRSLINQLSRASDRQHDHHSSEREGKHQALLEQNLSLIAKKPLPEFPYPPPPPSHPLQARNPQQTQPQLEGVGAEAAES